MPDVHVFEVEPFDAASLDNTAIIEEQWIVPVKNNKHATRVVVSSVPFDVEAIAVRLEQRKKQLETELLAMQPLADVVETWAYDDPPPLALAHVLSTVEPDHGALLAKAMQRRDRSRRADWVQGLDYLGNRLWPLDGWLDSYIHYFRYVLPSQVNMQTLVQHIVQWTPEYEKPEQLQQEWHHGFRVATHAVEDVPALIPTSDCYQEQHDHLEPLYGDLPYVGFLIVHEFIEEYEWTVETWNRLFDLGLDVSLCIDIQTIPEAWQKLRSDQEVANRNRKAQELTDSLIPDSKGEKKRNAAMQVSEALASNQGLHPLRVVIAVRSHSREQLVADMRTVRNAGKPFIKTTIPKGKLGELAKFFSTTPTKSIDMPSLVIEETSHGVAATLPFGIRRGGGNEGVFWGLHNGTIPVFFNPLKGVNGGKAPGHGVDFGGTGNGKTTSMLNKALRMLVIHGWQVIMIEPQGHAKKLSDAIGRGAKRAILDSNVQINPFDVMVVQTQDDKPPGLNDQIQAVKNIFAIISGRVEPTKQGSFDFEPRRFDYKQHILIERSCQSIYAPWRDDIERCTPDKAPLMADFINAMRELEVSVSFQATRDELVEEFEATFLEGPKYDLFGHRSSVEFELDRFDCFSFDFSQMLDGPIQLLMSLKTIHMIDQYVRSPGRDRSRPLGIFTDEVAVQIRKSPALATYLEAWSRRLRTMHAYVIMADQYAGTWATHELLRITLSQCPIVMFHQQDQETVSKLINVVNALRPHHTEHIARQRPGEYLMFWKSSESQAPYIYHLYDAMTPHEWLAFDKT